jgi:hypothetical protein
VAQGPQDLDKRFEIFSQEPADGETVIDFVRTVRESIIKNLYTRTTSQLKDKDVDRWKKIKWAEYMGTPKTKQQAALEIVPSMLQNI